MRMLAACAWLLMMMPFAASWAQANDALLRGRLVDASTKSPVAFATVLLQGTAQGSTSDEQGRFELRLPSGRPLVLLATHVEYRAQRFEFVLQPGETREVTLALTEKITALQGVEVVSDREQEEALREQAGALALEAKTIQANVSPFGDFTQALSGQLGVVGNNELSASYAVRGGNFDENLVYVNGMEVYRPFLVRAGQQEGLSFINPDMVGDIAFSAGGWQAKYGDRLSSVLDITYRMPTRLSASASAGLLGGTAHAEGISKSGRFTHLTGFRYKSARYLLNTLETDGQYLPRFGDLQTYLTFDLGRKDGPRRRTVLSVLGAVAMNRYEVAPQSRTTNFGTFQQAFRLYIAFAGAESMRYNTWQGGLRLSHRHHDRFRSHVTLSALDTREREYVNVEGGYRLCDVDKNTSSSTFNECVLTRGAGTLFTYARNALDATILTARTQHELQVSDQVRMEFGVRYDWQQTDDRLQEYAFSDSAGYVRLGEQVQADHRVHTPRASAYWQQTHYLDSARTVTYGVRALYWGLGKQLLLSPRLQYAARLGKGVVWRWALGVYQQPPFYREMRGFDGSLHPEVKPQSSVHAVAGIDYALQLWGRPFKLLAEAYYKRLWNVVPYDVDNVRLRYYATNNAKAEVQGFDVRLSGEFIPDAESWFNVSLMRAIEDLEDDERGYLRRPSDQRLTFGMFFQDHLPGNPTWKVAVKMLYGTGLPYGPPNDYERRATLKGGTSYSRIDIGFSKLVIFNSKKLAHNPYALESLWIGLDVLNLVGVENNISFTWIPDFYGNQYAVPNSLSQRFFNLRIVAKY
jgi:hypothetical protein